MKFSTLYNRHKHAGLKFNEEAEPSLTKQSFAGEADINNLVARYIKTGTMPSGERAAQYGDFVGLDFRDMQNTIALGNEMFAELPADVRRRFSNDPAELVEFLADPANVQEAVSLGLIPGAKAAEPSPTPPAAPAAAPSGAQAPSPAASAAVPATT